MQEQIDEITDAISEMKAMRGENFTIKQLEKTRRSLEARMEKLQAAERKDDAITFEQLGVDRLFVDEAHACKNLFLYAKMRNVAGLTGGKGTIFATGPPVPEAKFETVVVQPSEIQKEMVADLSERAAAVHSGNIDPSVDNMLKITSDGRKIGLDQRLMNPLLPDDPGSKLTTPASRTSSAFGRRGRRTN